MKFPNKLNLFILAFFTFLFYRFFISTTPFVAHDWPLLFKESRNFHPFWSTAWDYMGRAGLGGPSFIWIDFYTNLVYAISNLLNIPWWLSQRIFWIIPFLLISILSSYKFSTLFINESFYRSLTTIIYVFNTYILLIVGGGQFGVAFAYGLSPLVLFFLINLLRNQSKRTFAFASLSSGAIVALDPRIALVTFGVFFLWSLLFFKNYIYKTVGIIILNFALGILLNSYWILPVLLSGSSFSNFSNNTSLRGVEFLSFANFSNSISLLHPNWYENIFGKIYFFKPEFLIIPILAFAALFLKNKKEIFFFSLIALLGSFLGKGTNEPFGVIYLTSFQYIPGFNLFRDSTKFFTLTALSYSVLIPYFLENVPRMKKPLTIFFILFWLYILKPGWGGQLTGVFMPQPIPVEYIALKEKIKKDPDFFRTLWVPQRQKFGYFEQNHPAIESHVADIEKSYSFLVNSSVKYIIVPGDTDGEIFLNDRKYDENEYQKTVQALEKTKWVKKVEGFGKISIFELSNQKDHFWSTKKSLIKDYKYINPTKYEVNLHHAIKGDIVVFSENYDPRWTANTISSEKYDGFFNSFILEKSGDYVLDVYYYPQHYADLGLAISIVTFISIGMVHVFSLKKRREQAFKD